MKKLVLRLGACAAVALACVGALVVEQKTTSLVVPGAGASDAPGPDGFDVGWSRYDVARYADAPALAPYREYFEAHCAGTEGLASAVCLSDRYAATHDHGMPEYDFFRPAFDPVEALEMHDRGGLGHCVSRSGLLATTLLSIGRPARVFQDVPNSAGGHTMVEVWDEAHGWVVFDPTTGVTVTCGGTPCSAEAARAAGVQGWEWRLDGEPGDDRPTEHYMHEHRWTGSIVYPEPWSYTRVGERLAIWPYRIVVVVAAPGIHVGWVQWGAYLALALAMLLALLSVVAFFRGRSATGRARPRPADTRSAAVP